MHPGQRLLRRHPHLQPERGQMLPDGGRALPRPVRVLRPDGVPALRARAGIQVLHAPGLGTAWHGMHCVVLSSYLTHTPVPSLPQPLLLPHCPSPCCQHPLPFYHAASTPMTAHMQTCAVRALPPVRALPLCRQPAWHSPACAASHGHIIFCTAVASPYARCLCPHLPRLLCTVLPRTLLPYISLQLHAYGVCCDYVA